MYEYIVQFMDAGISVFSCSVFADNSREAIEAGKESFRDSHYDSATDPDDYRACATRSGVRVGEMVA